MTIFINKSIFGAPFDTGFYRIELMNRSHELETKKDLETFLECYSIDLSEAPFPPPQYLKIAEACHSSKTPWKHFMPRKHFNASIKQHMLLLKDQVSKYVIDDGYYYSIQKLLDPIFESLAELYLTDGSVLPPIQYLKNKSATGRLVVAPGHLNVLLMSQENRKNLFCSRYGGSGKIVGVDYRAVEPRTALAVSKNDLATKEDDVYTMTAKLLNVPWIGRNEVKLTMLMLMYGASNELVKSAVPQLNLTQIDYMRSTIYEMVQYQKHVERLRNQYNERGRFYNHFGKPLIIHLGENETEPPAHKLFSYYVQSSAQTIVLYGFSKLVQKIEEQQMRVHPLFMVHDAAYFDIHLEEEKKFDELVSEGTKDVPRLANFLFPMVVSDLR